MHLNHRLFTTRTGQFILFKYTIYTLLAINIYLFAINGTFTETIDTAAWVVILALFEWETISLKEQYSGWGEKITLTLLTLVGYGVIFYSSYSYFQESEWLDLANSITWVLVILVLQYDVYFPGHYDKNEWTVRNIIKVILYLALFIFAITWGIQGEVLDFYDSFLWILSFFVIEMNVFNFEHRFLPNENI